MKYSQRPTLIRWPAKRFRQHAENFLMCRPSTAAGKVAIGFMLWTITAFCLYVGGKFLYALLTGVYAS